MKGEEKREGPANAASNGMATGSGRHLWECEIKYEPRNAGDSSLDALLDSDRESVECTCGIVQLDAEDIREVTLGVFSMDGCHKIAQELNEIILEYRECRNGYGA